MTNEQTIKAMTTRELAEYLFERGNCQEYCYGICAYQNDCEGQDSEKVCIDGICKWLSEKNNQPLTDDNPPMEYFENGGI